MTTKAARPRDPDHPGEIFLAEIREQPEALLRLLEHEAEFEAVARAIAAREPRTPQPLTASMPSGFSRAGRRSAIRSR